MVQGSAILALFEGLAFNGGNLSGYFPRRLLKKYYSRCRTYEFSSTVFSAGDRALAAFQTALKIS